MVYKKWVDEEKILLKKLYLNDCLPPSIICEIIGRTRPGILKQLKKLGLKHNKDQEKKCRSISNSGQKNGMYGKDSWSKGLTKETDKRLKNAGKNISKTRKMMFTTGELKGLLGKDNPMYGKDAWNKGLTKFDDERIMKYSIEDSIRKKEAWKRLPEEEKERRRKLWALQGLRCKKKETSIEKIIEKYLVHLGVNFEKQYSIGRFITDFYLSDYNLVIECQGDYWHANPIKYPNYSKLNEIQKRNIKRDRNKIEELKKRYINYLFLWEYDINYNYEKTCYRIQRKIGSKRKIQS